MMTGKVDDILSEIEPLKHIDEYIRKFSGLNKFYIIGIMDTLVYAGILNSKDGLYFEKNNSHPVIIAENVSKWLTEQYKSLEAESPIEHDDLIELGRILMK